MGWPENKAFSEQLPTLQLAWDSVSLGALKTCPRLYQLSIVEGWRSREEAVDLEFGILAHSGRERYYHARANGSDHDTSVSLALDFVLTASWDSELDRPRAVFCQDSYKNRFTLARTLVWYLDQWQQDPLEQVILASGKPAVEVSFRFELDFGPDYGWQWISSQPDVPGSQSGHNEQTVHYALCGHLDRLVRFNERLWVSDLKTTKSEPGSWFFEHFSPDNQMSLYSLAGKVVAGEPTAGVIVDATQVAVGFSRFRRGLIARTEAQLEEWLHSLRVLLRQAEQYARENFWPQNDRACYRCQFRSVCGRTPQVRESILASEFTKRTWDPTQARGDI